MAIKFEKKQSAIQKSAKNKANFNQNKPKNKQPASLQKNPQIHKKQAQIRAKTARLATLVSGKPGQQLVSDERICVCLSLCVYCIWGLSADKQAILGKYKHRKTCSEPSNLTLACKRNLFWTKKWISWWNRKPVVDEISQFQEYSEKCDRCHCRTVGYTRVFSAERSEPTSKLAGVHWHVISTKHF